MAHQWDSGFMVREPSWHKLEKAVLSDSPQTWDEARTQAGLTWEVESEPIYDVDDAGVTYPIPGYQKIIRDDRDRPEERILTVRPDSYHMIRNGDFGDIIDTVLGRQEGERLNFEALMSLYGGRMIVALCYFEEPLKMGWDSSDTFRYLGFISRHDGQGGLRGLPTNVRIQCANTMNIAEALDLRNYGFTIRHTANWQERLAEIGRGIQAAKGESQRWVEFAEQLAMWKVGGRQREAYLKRFLPVSDDDGQQKADNTLVARGMIRNILESQTCSDIKDSGYGLLMATTEWSDHVRAHNSSDSYVARQVLRKEEPKARSARILRQMAGIKL